VESASITQSRVDERGRNPDDWTMRFSVAGISDIGWQIPGRDPDTGELLTEQEVIDWVIAIFDGRHPELGQGEWRTITARVDGKETILTFRGSWVAGFRLSPNSSRNR